MKKLYIEPTSRCNLDCEMCFRKTWIDERFEDMPFSVFERTLDTMPKSVETIFFGGMGEPLAHPRIRDMVALACKRAANVELLSNGTLFDADMAKSLLGAGLFRLWLSIDSLTPASQGYQGHAEGGALRAIEAFNGARWLTGGRGRLGMTFVAMKSNVASLTALPDFMRAHRINDVNISNVLPMNEQSAQDALYDRVIDLQMHAGGMNWSNASSNIPLLVHDGAGRRSTSLSIPVMDWSDPDCAAATAAMLAMNSDISIGGQTLRRSRQSCRFIDDGCCFVRPDGDVCPCMGLLHSSRTWLYGDYRTVWHHSFGNMQEAGLEEIWRNEEFSTFRQNVRDFTFSPCTTCGGCDFRRENREDCFGNEEPTCGACLWSEGLIVCP